MIEGMIFDLKSIIRQIDYTIDQIKMDHPNPYIARTPDGRYIMLDALTAKANALVALFQLEKDRC
jgi:hypothetical protein